MSSALDRFEEQLVAASRALSVQREDLGGASELDEDMGYASTGVNPLRPDGAGSRKVRHRIWAGVAASGTALSGGIVAVILLLSSGASVAFAGWTAQPTQPTGAALAQSLSTCGNVAADKVLASEARGPYVAIVYMRGTSPSECVTHGADVLLSDSTLYPPSAFASPGAGKVTAPLISRTPHGPALARVNAVQRQMLATDRVSNPGQRNRAWLRHQQTLQKETFAAITGPNSLTAVQGTVGQGVTGVTFVLADGQDVVATVGHNWYLAWWPGVSTHNAYPTSIQVTTATRTTTAPYSRRHLQELFSLCLVNERCPSFGRGLGSVKLVPGVAQALRQHMSLFRVTPPATADQVRLFKHNSHFISRPALEDQFGTDPSQMRIVSFDRLGNLAVIPGTGSVCFEMNYTTGGAGGCSNARTAAERGTFVFSYSADAGRAPNSVFGLVPDGNQTVTVHLQSGQAITLKVKENAVLGDFVSKPQSVTLKNAAGETIRSGG